MKLTKKESEIILEIIKGENTTSRAIAETCCNDDVNVFKVILCHARKKLRELGVEIGKEPTNRVNKVGACPVKYFLSQENQLKLSGITNG